MQPVTGQTAAFMSWLGKSRRPPTSEETRMTGGQEASLGGQVRVERDGCITRITIASPGKKNAIDHVMHLAMRDALSLAAAASDVGMVVIDGGRR